MYTWYQMIILAFVYGFALWILEEVYYSVTKKKLVKRGNLHLPVLLTDAISILIAILVLERMKENWFILFLGSLIYGSATHAITGFIQERWLGRPAWDYSKKRFHIGQFICLESAIYYGIVGVVVIKFIQPLFVGVMNLAPDKIQTIIAIILVSLTGLDALITFIIARIKAPKVKETVFAQGYNIYKLIWLFLLGAFLGDITETIFCYVTAGELMSRSSVLYGPFSVVWGFGCMFLTMVLHKVSDKSDRYIFIYGTLLGGAYEYLCSVVTEVCFGTVFWDYSKIPFNLGGRINLLYCFFWGIAAVVWIKLLYPRMSGLIEKIPIRFGKGLTWVLTVFMIADMTVSAGALGRAMERRNNQPAGNPVAVFMDAHYPDSVIDKVYPNMLVVDKDTNTTAN